MIFSQLHKKPDYWFWELKAITGADPVLETHKGRIKLMREYWLKWLSSKGMLEEFELKIRFPNVKFTSTKKTSPETPEYNCILNPSQAQRATGGAINLAWRRSGRSIQIHQTNLASRLIKPTSKAPKKM